MTLKFFERRAAKEMCRKLKDGLGFSCRLGLIKRTILSLHGRKYLIETNAPEYVIKDMKIAGKSERG